MKKLLLRLGDYVFVMRPLILVPAWSFYLLGSGAGRRAAGGAPGWFDWPPVAPAAFYSGLFCLTAILVTAYLLNQIFDQESDRLNEKGHFLTRGIFTVRGLLLMAVAAFLVASYLFRFVSGVQRETLALAVVLSLAYSVPPLRLVARPFADVAANAIGYGGVAYVAGFASWSRSLDAAAVTAVPYVLLVGAIFLHTAILDVDGDAASGKRTTSVVLGVGRSAALAAALAMAGLGSAVGLFAARLAHWQAPVILGVCAALLLKAGMDRGNKGTAPSSAFAVQASTLAVSVAAVAAWPGYLLLLVLVVVAARLYYGARFGIVYPGPAVKRPAKGASETESEARRS